MGRRTKEDMKRLKRHAFELYMANKTLSMSRIARHVGVSDSTVNKWFTEWGLRKWGCRK